MRILSVILLCLLLIPPWSGRPRLDLLPPVAAVTATPVALDWRDPDRTRLGRLTFLGGVHLTGPSPAFGGFSAMIVRGDRFTLLSDGGNIVRFRLDSRWRISDARFGALPDGPGRGWHKSDRDSESLTIDPATGTLWVGFERANQIWRYSPGFAAAQGHVTPPAMADWPENGGAESLVRLRDGSFIVLSESERAEKRSDFRGIWFAGDPLNAPRRGFTFAYRPPAGFRATDMAELPDGRLMVLNRRASLESGFTAVLTILPRRAILAGKVASGVEIARFAAPVVHDNFEALAVTQEGDATILWIASDDNQLFLQRSLLLKFRLND